jgi:hypothetical protein
VSQDPAASAQPSVLDRTGVTLLDWNVGRRPHGRPGGVIASLFSLVVGDPADPSAARFTHARMEPDGPPRLWHAHDDWTVSIVLEGSIEVEGVQLTAGQLVLVEPGVPYGPLIPGPQGATVLEIFATAAATTTRWDSDDPRVTAYRERGWILDPPAVITSGE